MKPREQRHAAAGTREDLIVAAGILVCLVGMVFGPVVFLLLFFVQCNLTVVGILFPACDTDGHPLLVPFWALLQWSGTALVLQQLASYMSLAILLAVLGLCVFQELE